MAVFRTIIQAFVRPVIQARHNLSPSLTIGPKLLRDDPFGDETMPFYQLDRQSFCGPPVPLGLKDFFQNNSVLGNGAPEPKHLAGDFHDDFIEMPNVTRPTLSPPQVPRDLRSELGSSATDRLVRDVDAAL